MTAVDDDRLARVRQFRQSQDARRCRRLLRLVAEHPGCTTERVAVWLQVRTNTIKHDIESLDGRVTIDGDEATPFRLRRLRLTEDNT